MYKAYMMGAHVEYGITNFVGVKNAYLSKFPFLAFAVGAHAANSFEMNFLEIINEYHFEGSLTFNDKLKLVAQPIQTLLAIWRPLCILIVIFC
jgi:hypothetical protein